MTDRPPFVALAFLAAVSLGGCPSLPGGGGAACHCETITSDSKCVQLSAPGQYAVQLDATCGALEDTCTTAGASYAETTCPTAGAVAECATDYFSYAQTQYWYSTGDDAYTNGDASITDDCDGVGELTWF